MRWSSDEGALDVEAARMALVALAGTVPSYEPLDDDRVRIAPDAAILSPETAARLLASMPKPLSCHAECVGGVLEIKCELLAELGDEALEQFESRHDVAGAMTGLFGDLTEQGEHAGLVAAFGRGEPAYVSLESARRWSHDYEISYAKAHVDGANDAPARAHSEYDEARRRGAATIVRFTSLASEVATIDGGHFPFPLPDSATAEDLRRVERTFVEMAKHLLLEINDEEELAAVERELVERGELPADSTERYTSGAPRYMQRVAASQMRKFFEGRPVPAECAAFIDSCGF